MERHREIEQLLEDMRPRGLLRSREITVDNTFRAILERPWLSYHVFNDGAGDVYILHEDIAQPWTEGYAPIKTNEDLAYDLVRRKPDQPSPTVYAVCQSGVTATIRVFYRV